MSQEESENAHDDAIKFVIPPNSGGHKIAFADSDSPVRFQIHSYERSSIDEEEDKTPPVLEPDHPLLARFQKALKEHLQRQIEHLRGEVFELETGAKKKSIAREQLGIEAYEAQQVVNRQQQELEMCVAELDTVCSATEQLEFELDEVKDSLHQKRQELHEAEKKELHLRTEVESLNLLLHQVREWENEVESELTINQRVFEKTKKDKFKLVDEKRQLDMLIYRLMTEIWRLEEELETIDMQLRVKEEEREKLAEAMAASNVDIETLNSEQRCMLHSWNSLIVLISHRDKHYNNLKQELDELHEKLRSMAAEIEQTKKLCQKEMMQNERLTDIKCRVEADIENCLRLMEVENKKRNILEAQMDSNQILMDQIEKDIKRISAENANKSYELATLVKESEKLCSKKVSLEEQILKTLEEQLTNDKAAKYLNKVVSQSKGTNRSMEINLANIENQIAKLLMEMEAQRCLNDETQRFLDDMIKQQNALEGEVKESVNELEKLMYQANKKQREIDILSTKIETAINKQGGLDMSPEEIKLITLEKNIEDAKNKIKELQRFWLRQQGHVVSLSCQRQEQINDLNMLKKQMLLLIQKNLKINDELEAHRNLEEKMNRQIISLRNRLDILSNELFRKRGSKDILGKDNEWLQAEYGGKLQDAEIDSLNIEAELTDLEEDKVNLSNELIELNREALTWEKKIQMAVETKKNMDEERGAGGEIGNMKAEIHRMNVRFGQLRKAQDKLILDLEHCISRRDAIITVAEAREKREKGGSEKTRINFTRKLDDMRNKVTQLESEVETLEKKMEALEEEERRLVEEIAMTKEDTEKTKEKTEEKRQKVEEAKTVKRRNLEVLVLKQKKLKVFSELSKNRHPYILYRTESSINTEYDKQKQLNGKLLNIMENLISDFPNYFQVLTRIQNTLRLPLIYL